MIFDAYKACLICSINAVTSPTSDGLVLGPLKTLLALPLSFLREDKHLANTDSPIKVTGMPQSKAEIAVHFPVPGSLNMEIVF